MACASASGSGSRERDDDGDDGNPIPPKKLCSTSLKLQFEAEHYPVSFLEKYRKGLEYKFIEENRDGIREFRCKIVYRNQRNKERSITGEICPSKREAQNNVAHAYMQRFGGWRKIVPPEMIIDENNEASAPLKAESVESQLSKFSRGFFKVQFHSFILNLLMLIILYFSISGCKPSRSWPVRHQEQPCVACEYCHSFGNLPERN